MDECTLDKLAIDNYEVVLDELMSNYGQQILQLVYSYVNNQAIAEDLTQDIFVKCYQSLHTYKGKSSMKTWLWRIAINHCKDYLKSWYNKKVITAENETFYVGLQNESAEQTVIQQDEDARLVKEVMNLPIKYREIIYLFYFEELLMREIAVIIGINESTVKTRIRKAKKILKERLGDEKWMID